MGELGIPGGSRAERGTGVAETCGECLQSILLFLLGTCLIWPTRI